MHAQLIVLWPIDAAFPCELFDQMIPIEVPLLSCLYRSFPSTLVPALLAIEDTQRLQLPSAFWVGCWVSLPHTVLKTFLAH